MSTERCPSLEALSASIDGELDPRRAETIAVHARSCPVCAPALEAMVLARESLRALAADGPGFDMSGAVLNRLPPPQVRAGRRANQRMRLATSGAAALAALAVGGWLGAGLLAGAGAARTPAATSAAISVFGPGAPGTICAGGALCERRIR